MGVLLIMMGAICVMMSIIIFILYLTMGKAVGKKLMRRLKDEY